MVTALSFRLPRTYNDKPRIWFESLETRRLFSVPANTAPLVMLDDANNPVATVQIIDGTLTVTTTNGIDDAMIGTSQSHPGQLFVHNNGARSYFSREGITGISVNLGDGDDAFCFHNEDGLVNLPTTINGGAGDDEMGGETDRDFMDVPIQIGDGPFAPLHLIGGEGDDSLGGALGDTFAEGGPGNDTMRGGKSGYEHYGAFTILDQQPDPAPTPTPESTPTTEPQAEPLSEVAAVPTASLPATPSGTLEASLLKSEGSLLNQHTDEIW